MKGNELVENGEVTDIPGNERQWEDYKQAHLQATEKLATKLGPYVDNWEISNEPDASEKRYRNDEGEPQRTVLDQDKKPHTVTGAFDPGFPAKRYGELLNEEYDVIKRADKNTNRVLTAGMVAGDAGESIKDPPNGTVSYLEKAWEANGRQLKFDGIAIHPYGKRDPDSFQHLADEYQALGRKISKTDENPDGTDFDLYVTEASYGPGDPKDPETRTNYLKYMDDIAHATDDSSNVKRTYFFWAGTNDDHPGVKSVDGAEDKLKKLQGK
jgi:hypothetical protein